MSLPKLLEILPEIVIWTCVLPFCDACDVNRWKAVSKRWSGYLSSWYFYQIWQDRHVVNDVDYDESRVLLHASKTRMVLHYDPVTAGCIMNYTTEDKGFWEWQPGEGSIFKTFVNLPFGTSYILSSSNGFMCWMVEGLAGPTLPEQETGSKKKNPRLCQCGTKAWDMEPDEDQKEWVPMILGVANAVFRTILPPLVLENGWSRFVKLVAEPGHGYKVGVIAGPWLAIYDSQVGHWVIGSGYDQAEHYVDLTTMDMDSCVYFFEEPGQYEWIIYGYDLNQHQWGISKLPNPVPIIESVADSTFFLFKERWFYACPNFFTWKITVFQFKPEGWSQYSVTTMDTELVPERVTFNLDNNWLLTMVLTRAGCFCILLLDLEISEWYELKPDREDGFTWVRTILCASP